MGNKKNFSDGNERQFRALDEDQTKDVEFLKQCIPELRFIPDFAVAAMWQTYSEDCYCAGWLILERHDQATNNFEEWLFSKPDSSGI